MSSPTHQRRMQRQLLFSTPFQSLKIRVAGGEKFDKSGFGSVKDPVCVIRLGNDIYESAVGKSCGKDAWDFDSSFVIPFNGQPRLRFLVKDKKDNEIGFHDLNLTTPEWHEAFTGPIELWGPKGPAGSIKVYCEPVNEPVVSARGMRISDGTPLAGFAIAAAARGFPDSQPGAAAFGALRVNILAATGLLHDKTRSHIDTADPFVEAVFGRHTLRTKTIKDGGANPVFGEGFVFPYDGSRKLTLQVYDASDLGSNKMLCTTTLDLAQYLKKGIQVVSIPLMNDDGKMAGTINAQLSFLDDKETVPFILPLSQAEIQGVAGGAGVPLVKSVHLGICNAEFTPGADSKKNAKLDTRVHAELSKDQKRKTKTAKNGGTHPSFDEILSFPYSGERVMNISFELDELLKNKTIATATVDLHAAAEKGSGKKPIQIVLLDAKTTKPMGMLTGFINMSVDMFGGVENSIMTAAEIEMFRTCVLAEVTASGKGAHLSAKSLRMKVFSCEGLGSGDAKKDAKIDPYVFVQLDKGLKRKTRSVKNSGGNPAFNQLLYFPYDAQTELEITVYDDDTLNDSKIAMVTIPVSTITPVGEEKIRRVPLVDKHHNPKGFMHCALELSPLPYDNVEVSDCSPMAPQMGTMGQGPKTLLVKLIASENVSKGDGSAKDAKLDPMVFCELNSKCKRQSATRENDGADTLYSECLQFPYGGESSLAITIYDENTMMKDKKLAEANLDLALIRGRGLNADMYHRIPLRDHHGGSNGVLHAVVLMSSLPYDGREQWKWDPRKDMTGDVLAAYTAARKPAVVESKAATLAPPVAATVYDSAVMPAARSDSSGSSSDGGDLTKTINASSLPYAAVGGATAGAAVAAAATAGAVGMTSASMSASSSMGTSAVMSSPKSTVVYNSDMTMKGIEHDCKQVRIKFVGVEELKNPDLVHVGHMDPYVKVDVGRDWLRTKTIKDSGKQAILGESMAFPFSGKQHIKFTIMEDDKLKDKEIGSHTMDLAPLFAAGKISCPVAKSVKLPVKTSKGKPAGFILMELHLLNVPVPSPMVFETAKDPLNVKLGAATAFMGYELAKSAGNVGATSTVAVPAPAVVSRQVYDRNLKLAVGSSHVGVYITCERATALDNSMWMGHADPYLICTLGSNKELKSNVFKDAGKDANFRTTFTYPFNNERFAKVEVFDKNTFKDGLIGTIEIDLLDFVDKLESERMVTIYDKKGKDSGKMVTRVKFGSTKPKEPTVITLSS